MVLSCWLGLNHDKAAELFALLSVSPSAPSCHFSWLQAQEDNSPSAVLRPCSPAFPSHLQGRAKWFLQDENFSSQGRMPQQGLVSMRSPLLEVPPRTWAQSLFSERYRGECRGLGGYSRIHNKFDSHRLDRAWHCETPFRGAVFLPPIPGKGLAKGEGQKN